MAARKKLTKSSDEKIISGVIAGIGEYLNTDPTLLRIIWLVAVAFTGFIPGIIAYIVAAIIVPSKK